MKKQNKILNKIKEYVAIGETEKAVNYLLEEAKANPNLKDIENQALLISAKYHEYKKNKLTGVLAENDNTIPTVNSNIISLITNIDDFDPDMIVEVELKKLRQDLIMAKDENELEKIKFEASILKNKHPEHFEANKLFQLASSAFKLQKKRGIKLTTRTKSIDEVWIYSANYHGIMMWVILIVIIIILITLLLL